ncbi:HDOD domain-containing protein [Dasania sp. GY-MA-18]|uniref:HDOD domain-containing protein n=1 Tax=Dasania phycosphaerae TaxID=2950436 RepID=A0A9J6RRI5_9GAMM|nr:MULTISPECIES: HDOD domain-containing protein [Dasania]MCR8924317.1 HDOD domain-containing protein [Dasania sp. GY-MA-18]MCZ0866970.1 HDOD domain-containing protein [Dasania phycosphaerae]MCZ0870474.1 HDOD domain-containing protein [Dasania phycosphaerae]
MKDDSPITDKTDAQQGSTDISGHCRDHGGALLARQPIFNDKQVLLGYELLCRSADKTLSNAQATADVIVNAFSEAQMQDVVGEKLCFINFSSDLLHVLLPLPSKRVVIEILEFTQVDDQLISTIKLLKERGYLIALDDFHIDSESIKLLPYADIIKLDVLALGEQATVEHFKKLRDLEGVKLLAEKVEDHQTYNYCLDLGFDYFQGYFFAKPDLINGKRIKENKQVLLHLMGMLNNPDVMVDEVEQALTLDPVLSFKVLRLVNSAGMGLSNNVESIKHAITIIGLERLRSWVMLLALANLSSKPEALSLKALEYAKMCERLVERIHGEEHARNGFCLGLFALLDAFLDVPMETIIPNLSLSHSLSQALLGRQGEYGVLLAMAEALEEGRWDELDEGYLAEHELCFDQLMHIKLEAQYWAEQTLELINQL